MKNLHLLRENTGHAGEGQKSLKRATAIIGMAPDLDPTTWDHREQDRYGLGKVRPLEQFYKLFLIDAKARKSVQLCPFVETGLMHQEFQPHLRSDGLGINYGELLDYNTMEHLRPKIQKRLDTAELKVVNAMNAESKTELSTAITEAERMGLGVLKPAIMDQAREALRAMK